MPLEIYIISREKLRRRLVEIAYTSPSPSNLMAAIRCVPRQLIID